MRVGVFGRYLLCFFLLFVPASLFAKVNVVVSIIPQTYFVNRLAGNLAGVTVMVKPGASPATYEPKPSQMKKVAEADIYFAIGVPFEKAWLPRFASQNRGMMIVDTTKGVKKLPMQNHHQHTSQPPHPSTHIPTPTSQPPHPNPHTPDPHVWLSPKLVKVLAENMAKALMERDPANKEVYKSNLAAFKKEIESLDERLKKILRPCRGEAMMVFHPSWGYFAKDYGLKQIPIEIEGKEPKSRRLLHLMKEAKEEGVETLFVQPQFSKRTAEVIADAIGAKIVDADPLAYEWSDNLLKIAKKICEDRR